MSLKAIRPADSLNRSPLLALGRQFVLYTFLYFFPKYVFSSALKVDLHSPLFASCRSS